jgi:two-component system LytT family response regulator
MTEGRIRCLLVDDEILSRLALRQALRSHPEIEIVGECGHGEEALQAIRAVRPDLLLLDIRMPGMDGFELLRAVPPAELPMVVFVTAFDEHALRAFDARALDYLLKPLDPARFDAAVERIKAQWRGRRAGAGAPSPAAAAAAAPALAPTPSAAPVLAPAASGPPAAPGLRYLERISVRKGEHIVVVRVAEIDWIHADGNYVRIHAGGTSYLHREALSRLAAALDPAHFLRIHRATLVNLDRIKEIYPLFYGDCQVLLEDGTRLTLSRRFRNQARQVLGLP